MTRMTGSDSPPCFLQTSGEQLALPMLATISCVLDLIIFSLQSVVVDVEGVTFRPIAMVVVKRRGVMDWCTRISSQKYIHEK